GRSVILQYLPPRLPVRAKGDSMKRWLTRIKQFAMYTLSLALFGFAFGQPDASDPTTWFQSAEAIVFIGGLAGTFVVHFLTAIGKSVGGSSGFQTVLLTGVFSGALALLAGLCGLGVFDQGLLPAVAA